jgi:hypothetical protein
VFPEIHSVVGTVVAVVGDDPKPPTRAERDAARRQQQREKDGLCKAKQRERQSEGLRLAAIAKAERPEEDAKWQAGWLAPAVLRHPI